MSGASPPSLFSEYPGAHLWWLEVDRALCRLLADRLNGCGWQLSLFHSADALWRALDTGHPDLLLLDVSQPVVDGLDLLRKLRLARHRFPILILSALASPEQRIDAFAAGANDVLEKPFRVRELTWRIERLLQTLPARRLRFASPQGLVSLGPLALDLTRNCLQTAGGVVVPISRGDRALLLPLLRSAGAVVSREQLANACGSLVDVEVSRSLDVRLSRLRRRLRQLTADAVSIEAVRGRGYRLILASLDAQQADHRDSQSA